jgi:hypothetical protein
VADDRRAGDVYAQVIDELLKFERDRKAVLEQKALAVITSSGVLVTLLFGFISIVKTQGAPTVPMLARLFLVGALIVLLISALLGLRINSPVDYSPLGVKNDLHPMVEEHWNGTENDARQSVAEFRVEEIDRWRTENGRKAHLLQRAFLAQSCGVALLALCVVVLLFRVG